MMPTAALDRSWEEIEVAAGLAFPTDYKDYVELNGLGPINVPLWPLNPLLRTPTSTWPTRRR